MSDTRRDSLHRKGARIEVARHPAGHRLADAPARLRRHAARCRSICRSGCVAGAVIALQIGIMRIFSVGSWAHFGSLVVSLAMLGFGLTSAVMCVAQGWFERHWRGVAATALMLFGPLTVAPI